MGAAGPQICPSPMVLVPSTEPHAPSSACTSRNTRQRLKLQTCHEKTTKQRHWSVRCHRGRAELHRCHRGAVLGGGLPEQALPLSRTPNHSIRRPAAQRTDEHMLMGFKPLSRLLEKMTGQPGFLLLKPPR